jgi:cytochrome c peroxidase
VKFTNAMIGLITVATLGLLSSGLSQSVWNKAEIDLLGSMSLNQLGATPKDPSNAVADSEQAAVLGQKLFFDKRLSSDGSVACVTCHSPAKYFADDQALSEGVGMTNRKAPSIVGSAFYKSYFWDGRADSQWSQALGPLESGVEHGGDRTQYARVVFQHYKTEFETLFGQMPDLSDISRFPNHAGPVENNRANNAWQLMYPVDRSAVTRVFVNIGKVIAAYERKLNPGRSRFDNFVETLAHPDHDPIASETLNDEEMAGLRLFIGKAGCVSCHNGPLLTDTQFHNTGVPTPEDSKLDLGRGTGLQKLAASEFTCLSEYSDAKANQCNALGGNADTYDTSSEIKNMNGAFKTPSLRGASLHAPFMHAGQLSNLQQVLRHYNSAPRAPTGQSEIKPLNLSNLEMQKIQAFLKSLEAPINADVKWLEDPFSN